MHSENERDILEIELPTSGKKAIIKSFLTIKEEREIIRAAMATTDETKEGSEKYDIYLNFERVAVEQAVVSLDGSSDNIWGRLEEYPAKDYAIVKAKIDFIREQAAEKKS